MKRFINVIVTVSAIVGIVIFIGAVGNMDYMVTIGQDYPLVDTVKMLFAGFVCVIPAIIREVLF